jgi:hypothetical protein
MQAYNHLVAQLGDNYRCNCSLWNFEAAESREFREAATEDAANAEMLIFSAHNDAQLPGKVMAWLASWLEPEKRHPAALMALFDHGGNPLKSGHAASEFLEQTANRCGMDFFIHTGHSGLSDSGQRRPQPLVQQSVSVHVDTRHWGINE